MIKKLITYGWSLRYQFAKYFIVGISGLVIDMATLVLFKEVFGWWPVFAVMVNQLIILVYNFSLNKYWSFKNTEIPHKQIVRYLILAVLNYCFSVIIMYIFNHQLEFDYRIVRLCTIAAMVSWNFFLYKYWVYKIDLSPKS